MRILPLGRVAALQSDRAGAQSFQLGLELVQSGTGRLNSDTTVEYEGNGTAFVRGDILFGKLRPYLAKVWLADRDGSAVGDFLVLRPILELVTSRYLRYALLASKFIEPVTSSVFGAKMPRASWEFVRSVGIYLPDLEAQEVVTDYLDRETTHIDALIAKQEAMIRALEERRVAMIRRIVTAGVGQTERSPTSRAGWLAEIPSHWAAPKLRRIARLITGTTPPGAEATCYTDNASGRPWVRPQDLSSNTTASAWLTDLGWASMRPVASGSVLVGCIAYSLGKVGFVDHEVSTNQQITSIATTGHGRYLYYVMLAANQELWATSHINRVPILNNEGLGSIHVPWPGVEEQRSIAIYLDDKTSEIDGLISKARQFIVVAKERRTALITAAVTGQIDVTGMA